MRAVKGRIVPVLLCAVAIVLGCRGAALAKGTPPSINDIAGTYAVKYKEVLYTFGDGSASKWSYAVEWEILLVNSTDVEVHVSAFLNDTFRARYENGMLIWGEGDAVNKPAGNACVGYAVFSGTSGKIKMKGMSGYDRLTWGQCETDTFSGKMTVANMGPFSVSSANGDAAGAADAKSSDVAPRASAPTYPSIDDILYDYTGRFKGTKYYVSDGTSEKVSMGSTFRVYKIDNETVQIDTGGDLLMGHYRNGILMVADVDNSQLAGNSMFMVLAVKGSRGKVSWKGWCMSTRDVDASDSQLDVATFTAKRVPDF